MRFDLLRCISKANHRLPFLSMLILATVVIFGEAAQAQSPPSFACRDARTAAELTICRVDELARLDRELTGLYMAIRANLPRAAVRHLSVEQRVWLFSRNQCGANVDCLRQAYRERIAQLQGGATRKGRAGQKWTAASTTAYAITGNIEIFADRIRFASGASIGIKPVGADRPGVYAVSPPTNPMMLNGNFLCGREPPTYIVLGQSSGIKSLKVFVGTQVPQPSNGPGPQKGVCAVFNFE